MEQKVNVWKASLMYGIILGMVGVLYVLLKFYSDLTIGNIYSVFQIVLFVYLLKLYRDNHASGNITYKQLFWVGVIIFFYYAIINAIFTYLLFEVIDTGLIDREVAIYEKSLIEQGKPQETIDSWLVFHREYLKPNIRNTTMGILGTMIYGTIVSLGASIFMFVASIFIKKKSNSPIDAPTDNNNNSI